MKKYLFTLKWAMVGISTCLLSFISPLCIGATTESGMIPSVPTAQATDDNNTNTVQTKKASAIFIQSAKEAVLEKVKDTANTYKVILKNVDPHVMYIYDRPQRTTGIMPNEKFLALWKSEAKNSFSQDSPNAFLHGIQEDSQANAQANAQENPEANSQAQSHQKKMQDLKIIKIAVQLSQPTYDPQIRGFTYMINPLDGEENKLSATTIYNVTLFIDDACPGCW